MSGAGKFRRFRATYGFPNSVLCVLCSRLVLVCRCQCIAVALFRLLQTRGFRKYRKVMKLLPYRNWSGAFAPLGERDTIEVYLTLRLRFLFLGAFAKLQKAILMLRHVCLSVRPSAWINSAPTGRIFMKLGIS